MEKKQVVNVLTAKVAIPINNATANEASQALLISDRKQAESKKDISKDENTFITFFIQAIVTWFNANLKTVHGMSIELKPYLFMFALLKKHGYSLTCYGALDKKGMSKTLNYADTFPCHIDGKTKVLNGGVIYRAIKDMSDCKVFDTDKKRYIHYINNKLHVFHVPVPQVLSKEAEQIELKKKEANDMAELEKQQKEIEAKKKVETKTETK